MGRDQKKHDKQKKRELKLRKETQHSERVETERRRRDQYPKIFFEPRNADPEFVKLVRESVAGMDFDDRTQFQNGERTFYRLMRKYGVQHAHSELKEVMRQRLESGDGFGTVGEIHMLMGFGATMLNRIPEDARRRYMPFNNALVKFSGHDLIIEFSSLLTSRGKGGTAYHSELKPQIEFGGKQWTVAFSDHAIKQLCHRIHPRYLDYVAAGDAHALFSNCVYFEPTILYGNQPAFTFWDCCFEPPFTTHRTYIKGVLGEENVDPSGGECYYRIGYCPVVFEGKFAKAKTLLYPGYTTTPEYGLVLRSSLSGFEKNMLIQEATTNNSTEVVLKDNSDAIKWFHDHGIPQVVQMKREVFVHYAETRRRNQIIRSNG